MHCIFIHGTGGDAKETFFPWTRSELEKLGHKSSAPDLPSSSDPIRDDWIETILDLYDPKEDTVFIGRSLGGSLIPYLLERDDVKAKAAFSIAAPLNNLGWENLVNFFSKEPDFEAAGKSAEYYYHWNSDDDPHVPLDHGEKFQKLLGGELRVFHGYSHFYNEEFPELVEAIKNIVDLGS